MRKKSGLIWTLVMLGVLLGGGAVWLHAQSAVDPVVEAFKVVEVSSVADAIEQLYGTKNYMSQEVRPLFKTKFAGRAHTVALTKYENKEGGAPTAAMLEGVDTAPAGSVFVMGIEDGASYGVIGGLMGTTLKFRGVVGAVVDGGARDLPQLNRLQFPVFSRGVAPGTTVGHYRAARNVAVTCGGVKINPGDIISADEDGVVVIPRAREAEILKKAQALDYSEHATYPFIEETKSLVEAVKKFGRI
jgi:4-hydroxy-4-methyl-2-oxoglutarate aldolase